MPRPSQANSVRSLARRTGVSATTVSRVLRGHVDVAEGTRRKVLAAAQSAGLDAPVAVAPTTPDAGWIGLVYTGGYLSAESAYDARLLAGVRRGLGNARFGVAILHLDDGPDTPRRYTEYFRQRGLVGALIRTNDQTRGVCLDIARAGVPCIVLAERFTAEEGVPFACCDSGPPSRAAVTHLLHQRHRRVALITARMPDRDHQDRIDGYQAAHRAAGLPVDPGLTLQVRPRPADAAAAIRQLLALPEPPTAVFVTDPEPALGVMCELARLGVRVPEQFSLVGFDDDAVRRTIHPTMSAVCQDAAELGFEAAQRLNRLLLNQPQRELSLRLQATFEINDSTGPAPAGVGPNK